MGLTKAQLEALNISSFPDNTSELITPEILRTYNSASIANTVNQDTYTTDSASFNSRIDTIVTGTGFVTTSSFNAYTSSNDNKVNSLINATASYANSASVAVVNNAQQEQINSLIAFTGSNTNTSLNSYTASNDTKWSNLGAQTGSFITESETGSFATSAITASSLITASISGQTLTFTKGDASTFGVIIPTGSGGGTTDITSLNAFTASQLTINTGYNTTTASLLVETANLELFSASTLTRLTNIETTTASLNSSVTQLNANTASQQSQIDSLISATGSYSTSSVSLTSLNSFTSSQLTINTAIGASTSSLNTATASLFTSTSLSLTTASFAGNTLTFTKGNGTTFGVVIPDVSGSGVPTGTISGSSQITDLGFVSSSVTASSLVTASIAVNVITFTKGDGSTFDLSVVSSGSVTPGTISGSAQITELGFVSSSVTASSLITASFAGNTLTFTKGDASTFGVVIPDVSGSAGNFVTTSSFNAYTQSNDQKVNSLISATGSYATTGSNRFVGNQTLTGSLFVSGNINMVNGADIVTHHVRAEGSNGLELQTSAGAIIVSMGGGGGTQAGFVGAVTANSVSASSFTGLGNLTTYSTSVDSRLNNLQTATASLFTSTSLSLTTASFSGNTLTFTKGDSSTFGVVIPDISGSTINTGSFATTGSNTFIGTQTISGGIETTNNIAINAGAYLATNEIFARTQNLTINGQGSVIITNFMSKPTIIQTNTEITGALNLTGNLTASLQQGFTYVGDANGRTTLVATSSFGGGTTIPAGTVSSSAQITALGFVSSSVTASSLVTASFSGNTLTFTKGDSSTFGVVIPDISGSTINTGSFATTGSNAFFGTNTFSGAVSFTGSAPSILSQSFSGSLITNLTDIYTDVAAVQQIVTLTSASYAALASGSLTNPNTLYIVSGSTSGSGGGTTDITSLNAFTASQYVSNSFFATTASFNSYTSSNDQKVNSLISATGSYATTGSNTFTANQFISGTNYIQFGGGASRIYQSGRLTIDGDGGAQLRNVNSGELFIEQYANSQLLIYNRAGNEIQISGSATKIQDVDFIPFSASLNTRILAATGSGGTINTGSFATTGSNNFIGNQTITGNLLVSGSNPIDLDVVGRVSITGPTSGTETPRLFISSSDGAATELSRNFNNINTTKVSGVLDAYGQIYANTSSVAGMYMGVYDDPNFNTDVEVAILVTENGSSFNDWDNGTTFGYVPFLTIAPNTGNNPTPVMTRGLNVTGSVNITGQYLINGVPISGGASINTGSFATTGSNSFNGNQTITGSLLVKGNTTFVTQDNVSSNIVLGLDSMFNSTNATDSIAIGNNALRYASGSQQNIAIGKNALLITSGSNNFALGNEALSSNITGNQNVALGIGALSSNKTGNKNLAIGNDAGIQASGSQNIFIGASSGQYITGSNNTIIGSFTSTAGTVLNDNIILADGSGNRKAQYSGSAWNFSGGINIASGSNLPIGVVSVSNFESSTINNSLVTVNSIIILTPQDATSNGDAVAACVFQKTAGSFKIKTNASAGAPIAYLIINPSII